MNTEDTKKCILAGDDDAMVAGVPIAGRLICCAADIQALATSHTKLLELFNEIGKALDEDDCLDFFDSAIYKRSEAEFQVMHDPVPSYWEPRSPTFSTMREAVEWLINERPPVSQI